MTRLVTRPALRLLTSLVLWSSPPAALALILDSGDGSSNDEVPADDPGWAHVGRRLGGPSVIYLGNGWVLTAHHVGVGIVVIGGERYDPVAGTAVQISNPDGVPSDLQVFRLVGNPELPDLPMLPISRSTPKPGESAMMIGAGYTRGEPTKIDTHDRGLVDGWLWGTEDGLHWGTNTIAAWPEDIERGGTRTHAFATLFDRLDDPAGTAHEAQAAQGDSGGALFARRDRLEPSKGWVLAGVMFTIRARNGQPPRTAFYGDVTYSADLSYYRDQIVALVGSGCDDSSDNANCNGQGRGPFSFAHLYLALTATSLGALAIVLAVMRRRRVWGPGTAERSHGHSATRALHRRP